MKKVPYLAYMKAIKGVVLGSQCEAPHERAERKSYLPWRTDSQHPSGSNHGSTSRLPRALGAIGNKEVFRGSDFIFQIIKGPNARNDFHISGPASFPY